jgi:L-asparaginase
MSLRILATGGTFDKHYDPVAGRLAFAQSHLPQLLEQARVLGPVQVQVLMMIDSLEMLPSHREQVLDACRAATETELVVIHGTDTMVQTAAVLGRTGLAKTIVLTGAMVPCEVNGSDAAFNLGFALACARSLPAGVWIAMNGRAYRWDQVRKNREAGRFEASAPGDGSGLADAETSF